MLSVVCGQKLYTHRLVTLPVDSAEAPVAPDFCGPVAAAVGVICSMVSEKCKVEKDEVVEVAAVGSSPFWPWFSGRVSRVP